MNWKKLMIHHSLTADSGTVSWPSIRRYHMQTLGFRDVGYNWGLELTGDEYEALIGRATNVPGAHCSQENMNSVALSVCFVGNFDKFPPPPAQIIAFRNRIWQPICVEQYGFEPSDILFHREKAHYKSCPGNSFTMAYLNQFIEGVRVP